ncbi:hypothetical protein ABT294_25660 [Nonomuraea sp. NPDC000554]|uniref:hypothetical protein n=1 Tax=Nonomuraea sp. NPDC000554 TaxID=3154259 RepID=UPI0033210B0B
MPISVGYRSGRCSWSCVVRAVFLAELVGGEVADPLGLEGEQDDECSGCPGLDREGLVGQAALHKLPAFVVVEQVGGFLAWNGGDDEPPTEATVGGPAEEVADAVAALGVLLVEPSVEVVLVKVGEGGSLGVDPGQEVEGDQDAATQVSADDAGEGVAARAAAGSAVHHHLPEVLEGGAGRKLVEEVVADLAAACDEFGQDLGVRVFVNPLDGLERRVSVGEALGERLELRRDGAVGSGEQPVDLVGEDAVGAAAAVGESRKKGPGDGGGAEDDPFDPGD